MVDSLRNKHEHALDAALMSEEFPGDSEHIEAKLAAGMSGIDVEFVACRFFKLGPSVTVDVTILSGTV